MGFNLWFSKAIIDRAVLPQSGVDTNCRLVYPLTNVVGRRVGGIFYVFMRRAKDDTSKYYQ